MFAWSEPIQRLLSLDILAMQELAVWQRVWSLTGACAVVGDLGAGELDDAAAKTQHAAIRTPVAADQAQVGEGHVPSEGDESCRRRVDGRGDACAGRGTNGLSSCGRVGVGAGGPCDPQQCAAHVLSTVLHSHAGRQRRLIMHAAQVEDRWERRFAPFQLRENCWRDAAMLSWVGGLQLMLALPWALTRVLVVMPSSVMVHEDAWHRTASKTSPSSDRGSTAPCFISRECGPCPVYRFVSCNTLVCFTLTPATC